MPDVVHVAKDNGLDKCLCGATRGVFGSGLGNMTQSLQAALETGEVWCEECQEDERFGLLLLACTELE